jgi:hypothetical protein
MGTVASFRLSPRRHRWVEAGAPTGQAVEVLDQEYLVRGHRWRVVPTLRGTVGEVVDLADLVGDTWSVAIRSSAARGGGAASDAHDLAGLVCDLHRAPAVDLDRRHHAGDHRGRAAAAAVSA